MSVVNNVCPTCGYGVLQRVDGTFRYDVPDSIPGGPILFTQAVWRECSGCHEQILSGELLEGIGAELVDRLGNGKRSG